MALNLKKNGNTYVYERERLFLFTTNKWNQPPTLENFRSLL